MDTTQHRMELIAELLKERIYATFALAAVLVSVDTEHTTPLRAMLFTAGTIVSLWAASLIATRMSQRLVFKDTKNHDTELRISLLRHSAMLYTLPLPLVLLVLAQFSIISFALAIQLALAASFLLFTTWTVRSARTIHASKLTIMLLILVQAVFIIGTVSLKVVVTH